MSSTYIGNYSIIGSLGHGSFGTVHKVQRKSDGKQFAMKSISLGYSQDSERILKEVRSHKSVPKHPNILEFEGHVKMADHLYIVLELCDLGTLEEYLVRKKVDLDTCVSFMADMARGLEHLHHNGVVHRDLKPENILLVSQAKSIPRCKICDFGVANMSSYGHGTDSLGEEYFSTMCGTPLYLAPEVTHGNYTKGCDIFSLGVVFYTLVAQKTDNKGRLLPLLKNGSLFCRADDNSIKKQVKAFVKREPLRDLICSMLSVDYRLRPPVTRIVEKLEMISVSDEEVFLVTCLCLAVCAMVVLLPLPLTIICIGLACLAIKELVPKGTFNWNVI